MDESSDHDQRNRPHVRIDAARQTAEYKFPSRPRNTRPLRDDYAVHAQHLIEQLLGALANQPDASSDRRLSIDGLNPGCLIEVETMSPSERLKKKVIKLPRDFEFPAQDIVILHSNRHNDGTESAILFLPDDAQTDLRIRIEKYGKDPGNKRRPDKDRFEVIEKLRAANVKALFTGNVDLSLPTVMWWELWVRNNIEKAPEKITIAARNNNIDVHTDRLYFPDTTVIFLHSTAANVAEFAASIPGAIREIRAATGKIDTFLERGKVRQQDWVDELRSRIIAPPENASVVCVLDTGVAASHPLIAPGLFGKWSYDAEWGTHDHARHGGHGTAIAGLVLYGDLEPLMNDSRLVQLNHGVESMKLLSPNDDTKPPSYGVVTQGAVSLTEIARPSILRSFCLASSTTDFPPDKPSTWSGALDQIAAGAMHGETKDEEPATKRPKRLIMVATGNMSGGKKADLQQPKPLEDPSQSWNSLTIGGITRKELTPRPPPIYKAVVSANNLSPFSCGSSSLPYDLTPIKPEVLFEAGNMLADETEYCAAHETVSLLAPGSDLVTEPLVPIWATSAAVGMAGNFVGQLQATLPDLWPETHRALTIDSARWPKPIIDEFIGGGAHWKKSKKAEIQRMLRKVGYGVPDITRAVMSARNDATMIAEAEIQPYKRVDGRGIFNEMHFYDLPWPKTTLEKLENKIVTMKVTLSYFVEPNLSGKAATRPETYRSFGLRFALKKRGETKDRFLTRISGNQDKEQAKSDNETSYWLLGSQAVQAGSLHCDIWRGHAIDLALHDVIAIYPVGGWWKSHIGQKRVTDKARYALILSISAPGQDVDLHSEISALIGAIEIDGLTT